MDKKEKIFHFLEHGGNSSELDIFSGLRMEEASVFSMTSSNYLTAAISKPDNHKERDLYHELLEKGYSKQSIHKVLHHLVLEGIKQQRFYEKKSSAGKMICYATRLLQHITSKGLCLLKTQFIKKPKNPV